MSGREVPRNGRVEHGPAEVLHSGRVFDTVRTSLTLPSGLRQEIDLVLHAGAAAVAAIDADGRLVCVRQYRAAAGDWTEELPAGRLEPDEAPLDAARRELEEETGLVAARWTSLGRMLPAVGFCSEVLHLFVATDLTERRSLELDADEEVEVVRRRPEELLRHDPLDSKTALVAALMLAGRLDPHTP